MEHNYSFAYKNIRIRQLREEDIENIRNWRNNPINTQYLRKIPYITPEMQIKWFENYLEDEDEMMFAIDEVDKLNRVVGCMSLYNFKQKQAEFGKILIGDLDAHGKHCGVNALIALLKVAFGILELDTVCLRVYKDNIAAVKVYKTVGFDVCETHFFDSMEEQIMRINKDNFDERYQNA